MIEKRCPMQPRAPAEKGITVRSIKSEREQDHQEEEKNRDKSQVKPEVLSAWRLSDILDSENLSENYVHASRGHL